MSQHFMTVCVVCVLCAAHTPCSAHYEINHSNSSLLLSIKIEVENDNNNNNNNIYVTKNLIEKPPIEIQTQKKTSKKISHSEKMKSRREKHLEVKVFPINENEEVLKRLGHIEYTNNTNNIKNNNLSKIRTKRHTYDHFDSNNHSHNKNNIKEQKFIEKIFNEYGNGKDLTMDGFEKMIEKLGLVQLLIEKFDKNKTETPGEMGRLKNDSKNTNDECLSKNDLLKRVSGDNNFHKLTENGTIIPYWMFKDVCPILLYHLSSNSSLKSETCIFYNEYEEFLPTIYHRDMFQVWVYATISIVIISLCGLLGVAVIPVMGKSYYHQLIQFLVALAIGTLCGDALIHLLPHAMMPPHSHGDEAHTEDIGHEDIHNLNMWKGLVAMIGLILFFFTEKALSVISEWRKHLQRKSQLPGKVRVMRETEGAQSNNTVGEKLCKHKYSSYPYCYGEITTDNHHEHNNKESLPEIEEAKPLTSNSLGIIIKDDEKKSAGDWNDKKSNNVNTANDESYTVIIREHENTHHGHTHSHGHVHAAPNSMSSVAWMVIMGDGLHNFTDGMAIGAAFAANIAGGFSTAIAVFCHELPHELGDFAVLLKAGMSAKQAVFYNLLSSVLCLFGMIFGVLLGAKPATTSWVFAAAAGMFIYIALVDMIPELSSGHSEEGSRWQCVLQALGLITGLGIMLIIALYEHDLQHIFDK